MVANSGFLTPRPSACPTCKGGRHAMRECETCAGTGTVFKINNKIFPDTREGFNRAEKELVGEALSTASIG